MRAKPRAAIIVSIVIAFLPSVVQTRLNAADDHHRRTFELVSRSNDGAQADNDNDPASISADGRYVAFASIADNLVPGDTNSFSDVFVRDRETDTIERVSVGPFGVQGNGDSGMLSLLGRADISRDGRFVAFASEASNFVPGDDASPTSSFTTGGRTRPSSSAAASTVCRPAGRWPRRSARMGDSWRSDRFRIGWCLTATRTSPTMSSWWIG